MASTIQIKNSITSSNSPSSLTTGELAINVVDGNFFYGSASAVKQDFAFGDITGSNISASGDIIANSYTGDGSSLTGVGTVDTSGTPADNQISVFTDSDTIEGSSKLIFENNQTIGLSIRSSNSDAAAVTLVGGVLGSVNPKFGPSGSHSTLRMGLSTSGDVFDFQNNKIAFDVDATNTFIMADTSTPENLEIHADGNIELRADDELQIFSHIDASSYNVTASIISASGDITGDSLVITDITASGTINTKVRELPNTTNSDQYYGDVVTFGGGGTLTQGSIYYLNSSQNWALADASAASTAQGMLGIATSTGIELLVKGIARHGSWAALGTGNPLYLSVTAGELSNAAPSGSGEVVRVVGYSTNGSVREIYFNPSTDWIELA